MKAAICNEALRGSPEHQQRAEWEEVAKGENEGSCWCTIQVLLSSLEVYLARRPRADQPSLRPFFAAIKEGDNIAE